MNTFPDKDGILEKLSPRDIVVRTNLDLKICKLVVGTYCEVHYEPDPSNTMTPKTHGAIDLGKTADLNNTYKIFCL